MMAQREQEALLAIARQRWLTPREVNALLLDPTALGLRVSTKVPATAPSSGTVLLFDRKEVPYFRKDGLSWRTKKSGHGTREGESYARRCTCVQGVACFTQLDLPSILTYRRPCRAQGRARDRQAPSLAVLHGTRQQPGVWAETQGLLAALVPFRPRRGNRWGRGGRVSSPPQSN